MASKMQQPHIGKKCESCFIGTFQVSGEDGDWWLSCDDCTALMFCYDPMPHQVLFHQDPHKIRCYAGGYGSAKTSTCVAEMIRLTTSTPGGTSLIGAATFPQLEQTAKKDFEDMIHPRLIENKSVQKNYIDLINGHRILFRPLDDPSKARSLNLCYVHIEEGSEVSWDYFVQLQTRLRSHYTDNHKMIISTNPDMNHIRTELLLKADAIYGADREYFVPYEDKNPSISVHVASTRKNKYLPMDFYNTTAYGKPLWWQRRYLDASFDFSDGLVYPEFGQSIIEPFDIPKNWQRIAGGDFGIRDETTLLMGAINPSDGTVYLYDEYYESGRAVPQNAEGMKKLLDPIPHGLLRFLVGDPSGKRKGIADMRSLFDHYSEYGIHFEPGTNRIESGVAKVQSYFVLDKLKIFNTCSNLIREGLNYKYKPMDLSGKKTDDKPVDGNDHALDSLKYMIAELPDDPAKLIQKSYNRHDFFSNSTDEYLPHALQTEESKTPTDWMNYY